jgi:hypothetical protein
VNVIETERLRLESLDLSRLEEFVVLTADPETMRTGRLVACGHQKLGIAFERDVVDRKGWPYRLYPLRRKQWASR